MAHDPEDERPGAGRTALVTGASSGIGAAFAELLAQEGFDLVLTARRADRLEDLSRRLAKACQVRCEIVAADLADAQAPERIMEAVAAHGMSMDFLVNNAGYAVPGKYVESPWADQARFIQVMATAPAQLAHLVMKPMQSRGWGRIVNVASLAGIVPGSSGHTLYAAVKAFMIKLSESLHAEGSQHGVHALALSPGFIYTEMHDVLGNREQVSQLPEWMWASAEEVVRLGYDSVMAGRKAVAVNGFVNQSIAAAARVLPNNLSAMLFRRLSSRARMQERPVEKPAPAAEQTPAPPAAQEPASPPPQAVAAHERVEPANDIAEAANDAAQAAPPSSEPDAAAESPKPEKPVRKRRPRKKAEGPDADPPNSTATEQDPPT